MTRAPGAILRHLEQLYSHGTTTGLSEPDLLNRFLTNRDESAFATLVARYGPMILGVCRRILRDERDVEDAFQATFLIFVRRAHSINDPARLGPWLHGVAHRVAVRAKAQAAQRFRLEPTSPIPPESAAIARAENNDYQELTQILDTELSRLPKNLRAPIILCYLEGLTHDQAAQRLRWPVGTVRSRMARARSLLKTRLARRGITLYTSAIATALARQPVSISLLERTIQFSLALGSPKTLTLALTTIPAAALAKGVLQTMFVTKTATVAAIALGGVLALGGAQTIPLHFVGRGGAQEDARVQPEPEAAPAKAAQVPPAGAAEKENPPAAKIAEIQAELERLREVDAKWQRDTQKMTAALRENIESRVKELQALQRDSVPPHSATKAPQAEPRSSNVLKTTAPGEKRTSLDFRRNGNLTVGLSADGRTITVFNHVNDEMKQKSLPAINGERRQLVSNNLSWLILIDTKLRPAKEPGLGPVYLTHRIAAFNVDDGRWIAEELPEPNLMSAPLSSGGGVFNTPVYRSGNRYYAFSSEAARWGVLELTELNPQLGLSFNSGEPPSCLYGGLLYVFNRNKGQWEDLADKAEKAKATPELPAQ